MAENKHAMIDNFGKSDIKMHTRKYTANDKNKILSFMCGCDPVAVGGYVRDAITKEDSRILNIAYIKDDFIFGEKDIYHLKKYDAAVTDEFYDHVMKGIN